MRQIITIVTLLMIAACNNTTSSDTNEQHKDSTINTTTTNTHQTLCFIHTEGNNQEDTFAVRLFINENKVTGSIKHLPWQKDAQVGNIEGSLNDSVVIVKWHCTQEGMDFTVPVSFHIHKNKAIRQETAMNNKGEEYLPTPAKFTTVYQQVDCSIFPERDY